MEAVFGAVGTAARRTLQKLRLDEVFHDFQRFGHGDVEQRSRGPLPQGYGGEQGQQTEGTAAAGTELGVGDLDGVADADVAGAELVEAEAVGQLGEGAVVVGG